ncbi:MAG: hypothetical protein ACKO1X_04525 [Acidimicrobiales bacterium]
MDTLPARSTTRAPIALQNMKANVNRAFDVGLEAAAAFVEKRQPRFSGS